ncbi:DMT family transporter [Patescibacteria group bacterium]|nr:DMT family transporter [Patescibacteria group bacterium]MBU1674105.1 DMT family transporter [Patescibacteria group bacterium]
MKKSVQTIGIILVLGSTILWALNSNLLKLIYLEGVDPMTIVALRAPIAVLALLIFFLPFAKKRKMLLQIDKASIKYIIWLGTIFTFSVITWIYAIAYTTIANVVILGNVATIFTLIISHFWLKEKITLPKILAILLAFTGIVIITAPAYNLSFFSNQTFWGDLIALLHSVFWALWYILSRKLKNTPALATTTWSLIITSLLLAPWAIYGLLNVYISPKSWILIIATAIIAQSFGVLMLHAASRRLEASIVSIFVLAEVVFAIIIAYFMFDEIPYWYTYIGGVLVIISVIIISFNKNKQLSHN